MSYSSIKAVAQDLLEPAGLSLTAQEESVLDWADAGGKNPEGRQVKLGIVSDIYITKRQRKMVDDWIDASEEIAAASRLWSKVLAGAAIALVLTTSALVFVEYLRLTAGS